MNLSVVEYRIRNNWFNIVQYFAVAISPEILQPLNDSIFVHGMLTYVLASKAERMIAVTFRELNIKGIEECF